MLPIVRSSEISENRGTLEMRFVCEVLWICDADERSRKKNKGHEDLLVFCNVNVQSIKWRCPTISYYLNSGLWALSQLGLRLPRTRKNPGTNKYRKYSKLRRNTYPQKSSFQLICLDQMVLLIISVLRSGTIEMFVLNNWIPHKL